MPELNEYEPARLVNGVCHALPPHGLFRGVDTWGSIPPLPLFADEGALPDDQSGPGPLRVVFDHQVRRDLSRTLGSGTRERRHDNAILEWQIAERIGRKEHVRRFG